MFDDKHTSKYSEEIYIITKVNKNTLDIVNIDNNNEMTVKKSLVKIIPKPEKNIKNIEIKKARRQHKQDMTLTKENIQDSNIQRRKRDWKPTNKALRSFQ